MAPLMHEPRLDGYVTVRTEKQVTTGSIRIVLAAEELGPVAEFQHKREDAPMSFPSAGLEESFLLLKNNISQFLGSKAVAVQTEQQNAAAAAEAASNITRKESAKEKAAAVHKASTVTFQPEVIQYPQEIQHDDFKASQKGDDLRDHVEYELAWEFEMWRRTEEAKWRAELREKEIAALKAVEEDSRRKQMEQTAAIDKVRLDLANLETKLRAKLLAVEKRDRALILGEEEANLRKEALHRECAQRVADAEAVAKRLEADCQQRLELEQAKYSMLQQQYVALEQRLASTNSSLATVEKEFTAFKLTQRMFSEAELSAQILVLKHQCHELELKAEAAIKSRDDYKTQVVRLAKELAGMHRKRSQDISPKDRENAMLASLIETNNRKESEEKLELKLLKEQVERLQTQEQTALAAAAAAAVAAAAVARQVSAAPPKEGEIDDTAAAESRKEAHVAADWQIVKRKFIDAVKSGLKTSIQRILDTYFATPTGKESRKDYFSAEEIIEVDPRYSTSAYEDQPAQFCTPLYHEIYLEAFLKHRRQRYQHGPWLAYAKYLLLLPNGVNWAEMGWLVQRVVGDLVAYPNSLKLTNRSLSESASTSI